jgi:hypothetical protein
MKTIADIETKAELIDAVLADENWATLSASLRPEALGILRAGRRARVARIAFAQAACALGLLTGMFFVFSRGTNRALRERLVASPSHAPAVVVETSIKRIEPTSAETHLISEERMLKMLPAGSYMLAEIDGQKQLICLDRSASRQTANQ